MLYLVMVVFIVCSFLPSLTGIFTRNFEESANRSEPRECLCGCLQSVYLAADVLYCQSNILHVTCQVWSIPPPPTIALISRLQATLTSGQPGSPGTLPSARSNSVSPTITSNSRKYTYSSCGVTSYDQLWLLCFSIVHRPKDIK